VSAEERSPILREFRETDWPELEAIADAILPYRPQENQNWFDNVRAFDDRARVRRRYTAVEGAGAVIGYGSLERDEADRSRYRLRLLMEGSRIARGEGTSLVERLESQLAEVTQPSSGRA